MYEQMNTTKSLIVGLFIVTIVSPSHLQHSDGAAFRRKSKHQKPPQKVPHPCGSARVGQIQGGFNWIGSIRGLSKPYPFSSIT